MHDIDRTQIAYPGEMESYERYPVASESPALSEAEEMEQLEREILARIGVADPYAARDADILFACHAPSR